MVSLNNISDTLIAETVAKDDLNDALFDFQTAVGIDDGGVAGIVFSGEWESEWATATETRRREMMSHYINTERSIARI